MNIEDLEWFMASITELLEKITDLYSYSRCIQNLHGLVVKSYIGEVCAAVEEFMEWYPTIYLDLYSSTCALIDVMPFNNERACAVEVVKELVLYFNKVTRTYNDCISKQTSFWEEWNNHLGFSQSVRNLVQERNDVMYAICSNMITAYKGIITISHEVIADNKRIDMTEVIPHIVFELLKFRGEFYNILEKIKDKQYEGEISNIIQPVLELLQKVKESSKYINFCSKCGPLSEFCERLFCDADTLSGKMQEDWYLLYNKKFTCEYEVKKNDFLK